MKLISKKNAKLQGLPRYFTGKPCKHGHMSERFINDGHCVECKSQYRINNKEQIKTKDKIRSKIYRTNNTEKEILRNTKYKSENINSIKLSNRRYRIENAGKVNMHAANYRAAKLKRTPLWLSESDKREIELIYKIAERVSRETGIEYHVDHEIPLQGEFVSGLHIPDNLQLLKANENILKGNRFAIN